MALLLSIGAYSQVKPVVNDTLKKDKAPPKDRNMFGLYIPRGLKINSAGLAEGYVLFAVPNSPLMYLLNRRGEVVHQWKSNVGIFSGYMQDDGSLIVGALQPDFPTFGFGGPYGRLQKISWDGKILWDFIYADEHQILHHDFTVLRNGNILAIAYETKTYDEAISRGRKPEKIPKSGPWVDKIIEIQPDGRTGGKIVWEWHVWDHLIQDTDPAKANFGKPADHPELLDFDLGEKAPPPMKISQDSLEVLRAKGMVGQNQTLYNSGSDIFHFNAVKYNAETDQIVFSSPNLSEIYVIDHSTTTKQAAGHKGGRGGKGGDFLYRWGNPKNYQRGDSTNQKIFGQHDVRWIQKGLPGAGHLTLFNNDLPGKDSLNYSMIFEIAPPVNDKGNYYLESNHTYGPDKPVWTYMAPDTLSFYASFISGAQRMENGGTFINEGPKGHFFEVTPDGKMVWEYFNPFHGDMRMDNGDPVQAIPFAYWGFRANFIPAKHPGMAGKKLMPIIPQPRVFYLPPPDKK